MLPSYRARGRASSMAVALTFDDGPAESTHEVLDLLEARVPKPLPFIVGNRVQGRQDTLRRMRAGGHELGNHSFSHARLARRPARALRELRRTSGEIKAAAGVVPRVFRPPFGTVDRSLVVSAWIAGMVTVGWDVDPEDWAEPGAGLVRRRVLQQARSGSIVLLHDGFGLRSQTVSALPAMLDELGREHELLTVSEVIADGGRGN